MTSRNAAYDNPAYIVRETHVFPALAAGASGQTSKFVAFTSLNIFGVVAVPQTAGTSTYTQWNGTGTITSAAADSFSLIRIINNAAPGVAPSLSTTTYGPFTVGLYNGSTGVTTNAAGVVNAIQLYGTGTTGVLQTGTNSGNGGIAINQGDTVYIQRGTDATAVTAFALEWGVTPLANLSN